VILDPPVDGPTAGLTPFTPGDAILPSETVAQFRINQPFPKTQAYFLQQDALLTFENTGDIWWRLEGVTRLPSSNLGSANQGTEVVVCIVFRILGLDSGVGARNLLHSESLVLQQQRLANTGSSEDAPALVDEKGSLSFSCPLGFAEERNVQVCLGP
jgi:hypothetical protein